MAALKKSNSKLDGLPRGGERQVAELARLRVLHRLMADVRLLEVEPSSAEQAFVVHLTSGVFVTSKTIINILHKNHRNLIK